MVQQSISESRIWDLINEAEMRMSLRQRRMWDAVRVTPFQWPAPQYGVHGGEFWVVGVQGDIAIWYDDVEHGFYRSQYEASAIVAAPRCGPNELEQVMENLLYRIENG